MNDRLPMLPGERPSYIWRQPKEGRDKPPWYRFNPRVGLSYLPLLFVAGVVIALAAAFYATRRPVIVVINGEVTTARTHARTVRRVLSARGVPLTEGVMVSPGPATRLERGMVVQVDGPREVRVRVDGATLVLATRETEPGAIVAAAGVALGPADRVVVERTSGPSAGDVAETPALANVAPVPTRLSVVRAVPVTVDDGGQRQFLETSAPTVGEALRALDTPLYEADVVEPSLGAPLSSGMEIRIRRATPVTIEANGEAFVTRTQATTVGNMLAELGMALSGEDYTIPASHAPVVPGMAVQVVRAGEQILVEEEEIPFGTVWQPVPELELDEHEVLREGQPGVLHREVRVRYEDGVEVSRTVRGEWVAQEPVDAVKGYGTRIVIRTLDTEEGQVEYWRHIRVLATSYTAATSGKEPGSPGYGITGTGLEMRRGIVAVDPSVINFFTRLYVPEYGMGLAADAGGAIKGMRIDLGYDEDNLEYWYKWVDIYLLTPVPDPDEIIWVLPES